MSQTKAQLLDGSVVSVAFSAGTAGAPSLTFTSDPNTGIYSPGADQVAISTNGTGRLFVDASGRVGLGTSSPTEKLVVSGTGDQTVLINTNTSGNPKLILSAAGYSTGFIQYARSGGGLLQLSGDGTNVAMTVDSSSRVGIGSSSPGSRLEVGGEVAPRVGINSTGSGFGTPGLLFQGAGTTYGSIIENINSGELAIKAGASGQNSYFITFSTNDGSEKARLDASGRLLVGTSSSRGGFFNSTFGADHQLQIEAAFAASFVRNEASGNAPFITLGKTRGSSSGSTTIINATDDIGNISFQGADGSKLVEAARISAASDGTPGTNDMPGRLVFSTTADGASSPTERFRIGNAGQLGIGGATYGTSGQVLTSGGASAAPSWQDSGGGAGTLKAWVNFNGTGTVAIRGSGNVSSITDNGTGDYTVNFTTALADANYSIAGSQGITGAGGLAGIFVVNRIGTSGNESAPTASACRVNTNTQSGNTTDVAYVNVAIFR